MINLVAVLAVSILTIVSWLAIGYWSKSTEDLENANKKLNNDNEG
ncbi:MULTISPECIES: hypothetical protein [Rossellomorea]|nr:MULTISPECIES: hypothetical protein [Rossellomorea]